MKLTDGLFIRKSKEVSESYSEIEYEEVIIDAGCMRLVTDPSQFDMLLLENLYGDLVSDLCAGLVGGLGIVPGANIGYEIAVFEAVHGSAPDIAGKNIINPTATILSAMMMIEYLGFVEEARRLETAIERVYAEDRFLTPDQGGSSTTTDFCKAVEDYL